MVEKLNLVISDVDKKGGVAVHQVDAFSVNLPVRSPNWCSSPVPNDASEGMLCCVGQHVAVDVRSQLAGYFQKWTAFLSRDLMLLSLGRFLGLVEV